MVNVTAICGAARLAAVLAVVAVSGCSSGPERGEVTGTVKLDNQPLEYATVEFRPERGRPSTGITDAQGEYRLRYSKRESGAVIGKHTVYITTYRAADVDDSGKEIPAVPEKLPKRYTSPDNLSDALRAEVQSGKNVVDFNLTSEGPIVQPQ